MKKIIRSIALVVFTVGALSAGAQKIAHLSLDSLIQLMPESKTAQDLAQSYLKDLEKQMSTMDTELKNKYMDYQQNVASMSDLVRKTKEDEIQTLSQRIEEFKAQAQQDYQKKSSELSKPLYDKAKKAIEAVAKEGGYKYVLDTSSGSVLYSEDSEDILMVVKKKLDSMPAVVFPGAQPTTAPKAGTGAGTGTKPAPAPAPKK